jgi:tetratricopeptide (TPR) repeat protein
MVPFPVPLPPELIVTQDGVKARYCVAAFTRESLARSRDFFERAIALDPGFEPAHSGLASSIFTSVLPGLLPAREAMPLAQAAARKALVLNPASPEAHAALGFVAAVYELDWEEAERRFRQAISREPVSSVVRWHYAFYLLLMGRHSESAEQCVRGLKDDPLGFMGRFHYAGALLAAGNVEPGEAQLRELCELHPNLYQSFYLLGLSQSLRGLHGEALDAAEQAYSLAPWNTGAMGLLAGALSRAGEIGAPSREEHDGRAPRRPVGPRFLAAVGTVRGAPLGIYGLEKGTPR